MALTTLIIHCSGNRRSITTLLSACTTHKVCWSFSLIFLVRIPFSVAYFCPFLSFFLLSLFPPPPQTLCFFGTGHRNDPPFSFISVHFSILCRLFSMSNQVHFKRHSSVLLKAFTVVLILIFFFLIPLLLYCFGLVCVFCQMYPFLCCLHISLLNHSFQKQEHLWR